MRLTYFKHVCHYAVLIYCILTFLMPCESFNQVKFSEMTLENFQMLQSSEWEPNGSFYKSSGTMSTSTGQNGGILGSNRTILFDHVSLFFKV